MTNQIAIGLGLFIVSALIFDLMLVGDEHVLFLGKKLFEFLQWLAFWR
ncbi:MULTISPECIES: hypothetical protein [Roseobacteraceae]|uniref:Glyceraldehyde-3-phosphate dehydrogenase n=1 Tax=Falsiruegeria litorea TaxID=1280831 RepID=A0ABS5WNI3_9RHOB|nr:MULTISPECIES: hypothetical protein [Roseobacteraceae]MBT3140688.1 hypothetical protein [Falsiruegeria litorea]MBT8170427.1 hypothetical protein [Falsiruegeria litorea]